MPDLHCEIAPRCASHPLKLTVGNSEKAILSLTYVDVRHANMAFNILSVQYHSSDMLMDQLQGTFCQRETLLHRHLTTMMYVHHSYRKRCSLAWHAMHFLDPLRGELLIYLMPGCDVTKLHIGTDCRVPPRKKRR